MGGWISGWICGWVFAWVPLLREQVGVCSRAWVRAWGQSKSAATLTPIVLAPPPPGPQQDRHLFQLDDVRVAQAAVQHKILPQAEGNLLPLQRLRCARRGRPGAWVTNPAGVALLGLCRCVEAMAAALHITLCSSSSHCARPARVAAAGRLRRTWPWGACKAFRSHVPKRSCSC